MTTLKARLEEESLPQAVASKASTLGLVVVLQDEMDQWQRERVTSAADLRTRAPAFGLSVRTEEDLEKVREAARGSDDDAVARVKDLGFSVLAARELDDMLAGARTAGAEAAALEKRAADAEASSAFSGAHSIDTEALSARAGELGLAVMPSADAAELKEAWLDPEQVLAAATTLGMLCVPASAFVATTVMHTADPAQVTVVPNTYYNKLTRAEAMSVEKVSDDDLLRACIGRGLAVGEARSLDPKTVVVATPPARLRKALQTGSVGTPLYHELPANQSTDTLPGNALVRLSVGRLTPRASMVRVVPAQSLAVPAVAPTAEPPAVPVAYSPQTGVAGLQGLALPHMAGLPSLPYSLHTDMLLGEVNMIPAVTQVIIGEFLLKYYRRMGPLLAVQQTRHERFFWVHPYLMTLYWSTVLPVLTSPENLRVRACAIEKVELVDDANPLPVGAYHKTIVVLLGGREVRITAPNRHRHSIWYNLLRYLLQRLTEGLEWEGAPAELRTWEGQTEFANEGRQREPRRALTMHRRTMLGSPHAPRAPHTPRQAS